MTVLVLYHSSRFKNFKTFYNGIVLGLLRACFPGAPCYERFIALQPRVDAFGFFPRQPDGPEDGHLLHRQHTAAPSVTTDASPNTRFSLAWRQEERPAWAGFSASNCISCSTISARSSRSN